jgi:peroxiredoxin
MLAVALLTIPGAGAFAAQDKQADLEQQLKTGAEAMRRSQYDDALQAYKKAWSLSSKSSADACLGVVMAYWSLGAHKNVTETAADCLKVSADDQRMQARFHNLRGTSLVALADKNDTKRLQEAENAFRQAVTADADFTNARQNLGIVLLKMNRDDEGIRELRAYLDMTPRATDAARVRKMIENPRRARENYAPDFKFTSRDGEYIALEDLSGKTVVLDFWGSWCGPCVESTPGLVKLHKKYAEQGVVFLGVARDEEPAWSQYIDKNKMAWPQYLDAGGKIARLFGVQGYPTYIVLDGDGLIRARKSGYGLGTDGWLENEIKKTLKTK